MGTISVDFDATGKLLNINLSSHTLDDAVYWLLQKGLNFTVTPRNTPIEDILAGVEKAIQFLPEEKVEEPRQETVRIIKSSLQAQGQTN